MRCVGPECDGDVQKDLFDFPVGDSMFWPVLADVPFVPIASFPLGRVELSHRLVYIAGVYISSTNAAIQPPDFSTS